MKFLVLRKVFKAFITKYSYITQINQDKKCSKLAIEVSDAFFMSMTNCWKEHDILVNYDKLIIYSCCRGINPSRYLQYSRIVLVVVAAVDPIAGSTLGRSIQRQWWAAALVEQPKEQWLQEEGERQELAQVENQAQALGGRQAATPRHRTEA